MICSESDSQDESLSDDVTGKILKTGQRGRPRKRYQAVRKDRNIDAQENDYGDPSITDNSLEDVFEECEMTFSAAAGDLLIFKKAQSSGDAVY